LKPYRLSSDRRSLRNALMASLMAATLVAGVGLRPVLAHGHSGLTGKAQTHRSARADSAGDWRHSHHARREVRAKLFTAAVLPGRHSAPSAEGGSGIASVYTGATTASGEQMSPGGMTAAHRTLPFGTKVTVVNRRNGRSAVVRINDRGPFVRGRVIDLSPAAARVLGVDGLVPVSLIVGGTGSGETQQAREEE
jgi:rare lipoprotein A